MIAGSELREVSKLIIFPSRTLASNCTTGTPPNLFFPESSNHSPISSCFHSSCFQKTADRASQKKLSHARPRLSTSHHFGVRGCCVPL